MKLKFTVENLDCANCAAKIEDAVSKIEGVNNVSVSFMTLKMKVDFEEGVDPSEVMEKVRKNCKKIEDDIEIFI